ncbi:uncharacterized protein [Physcomitrium patens]
MNKDIAAPCEVCGGLLPLKPIPKRHQSRHHKERSLLQSQIEIEKPEGASRSQDSQAKRRQKNRSEKMRELDNNGETSIISDEETDESSGMKRSYGSVLKEIQAIFAGHKVKKETISPHAHRIQREIEGSLHNYGHHKRRQAHQHAASQHASESPTPPEMRSSHVLSPYQDSKTNNEPVCRRLTGSLPQDLATLYNSKPGHQVQAEDESVCKRADGMLTIDDRSNCNLAPLSQSLSPKIHVRSCIHHLGDHSVRRQAGGIAAAASSSPAGDLSMKEKEKKICYGDHDQPLKVTGRPSSITSPVENGTQLHEECHVHQIDDHLIADLRTRYPQSPSQSPRHEAGRSHTESLQVKYCCHQHASKQTVVHLLERCCACPVHGCDDLETLRSTPRSSKKCPNCGCPQLGVTPQMSADHLQPAKDSAKTLRTGRSRSREREVIRCAQISQFAEQDGTDCALYGECRDCPVHGGDDLEFTKARSPKGQDSKKCPKCGCSKLEASSRESTNRHQSKDFTKITYKGKSQSADREVITYAHKSTPPPCKLHEECCTRLHSYYCYSKKDHKELQRPKFPDNGTCPICEPLRHESPLLSPICKEAKQCKDPLVWNPRRVRKPGSTVHWLDKVIASKRIPAPIIEDFLCGRRRWPPLRKKHKCPGCIAKSWDKSECSSDLCNREFFSSWNLGSDTVQPTLERSMQPRGKFSRLAMSRNLIAMPVLQLSTSKTLWDRTALRDCSECRKPLNTSGGRWSYYLKEMSTDLEGKGDCNTKFSWPPDHGFSKPCEFQAGNLSCPELFSAFRLRSKALQLNSETFDRRAALQVAKAQGIKLDREAIDLMPDTGKSHTGRQRRRRHSCRKKRHEVYFGLCKIIDPPIP